MNNKEIITIEVIVDDIVIQKKVEVVAKSGKMALIKVFNMWKWIENKQSDSIFIQL